MATKVTMRQPRAEAPVETVGGTPAAPDGAVVVTDSLGRKLTVKKLNLMEEMNLMVAAGSDRSSNARWMQYATIVSCVRKIGDEHMQPPMTLRILQGNIQAVGSEGFAAAIGAMRSELPDDVESLAGDDTKDTAKN